MIPRSIEGQFPRHIRERGERYVEAGRVRVERMETDLVRGHVYGSEPYIVVVRMETPIKAALFCSCPYSETHGICKHLWALLLTADARGFFAFAGTGAAHTEPVSEWKERLRRSVLQSPPAAPQLTGLTEALAYTLEVDHLRTSGDVLIRVTGGGVRSRAPFSDEEWLRSGNPEDREIAHRLLGAGRHGMHQGSATASHMFVVPEAMYDTTLRMISDTGRLRIPSLTFADLNADPLRWDADEPFETKLVVEEGDADWRVRASFVRGEETIAVEEPLVISARGLLVLSGRLARADVRAAWPLIQTLRSAPLIAPRAELFDLAAELVLLPDTPQVELPAGTTIEQVRPEPQPGARLVTSSNGPDRMLIAEVEFTYDGLTVSSHQREASVIDHERKRIVLRSMEREREMIARLIEYGAQRRRNWQTGQDDIVVDPRRLEKLVLTLVAEGWRVEAERVRYRAPGRAEARISSGIDWFELEGGVQFGGERVPLARLLGALARGEKTILLDDGSRGILPIEWLRRYAATAAVGSTDAETGAIKFTHAQTALLDALLATIPETDADEAFSHIRSQLHRFSTLQAQEPPPGFHGELRTYQKEGLAWMTFLRQFNIGGCLADDMGLGKTVQVLAMLEERRQEKKGPSIIVVPKSLVFNWLREAARFTPQLRVLDRTQTQRNEPLDESSFDVLLITYGTLRRDAPALRATEFDYAILDEAQAIKNAATASAKASRLLRARHRLALSGTPIENSINELWSLFEFLNPGMFGAARAFAAFRATGASADPYSHALLARSLRPFLLRRTKGQVAPELPARIEQTLVVELEGEQRALYDSLRDHYRKSLLAQIGQVGIQKSRIQILEALLRLRQAACHPGLVDAKRRSSSSAKLDTLLDYIAGITAEGHKALVFSQFTSFLALVREQLDANGTKYEYLDGKTRDRQERVDHFQSDPDCPLFLISLRAGGQGLNLTAADYVFVLDPWWNPAVEAQAIDRSHRIGQERQVIALRLIARDTVEEKVLELQRSKQELADAILGEDAGLIARITKEDIELLLN